MQPHQDQTLARITAADLAPGERRARHYDPWALDVRLIVSRNDPLFDAAYDPLWREFGARHEMESRHVIATRLARAPQVTVATPGGPAHLSYQLILARDATGALAGVRDHTAILMRTDGERPLIVVHLSHVLVAEAHRGSGLAGWMRAWPIATARVLAEATIGDDVQIVLVAEMEHADPADVSKTSRLIAYEKAGFRKIDPAIVDYLQPDFREAATIDADTVRPLPMSLVVRRVGREADVTITGDAVRRVIASLYAMYGADFRAQDMAVVYDRITSLPADDVPVALVPPTRLQ